MLSIFPPGLNWLLIVMALGISSFEKTEMTHGWQVAMVHMVKSWLNHLKHISFITDWAQYHLLIENYIRAEAMA